MELAKNKVVMVTGGAGGIGLSSALALARGGTKAVYIIDIKQAELHKAQKQIEAFCPCLSACVDIADEAGAKRVFDNVKKNGHSIDVLVCAAGICSTTGIMDKSMDEWDKVMNVNLKGTFLYAREAMRTMTAQNKGSIITFTSIAGQSGGIRTGPDYAASKAGILGLTKSFAKLGASNGVRANCVSPGIVKTPMTDVDDFTYSADEVPMGRIAQPEEIANVVLFLASDMSSYITGECINVNGGMLMNA